MTEPADSCAVCTPSLDPAAGSETRLNERHVGVRFGDHLTDYSAWTVTHNGEDVTNLCVEAMAGPDGWVKLYVPRFPGTGKRDLEVHYGPSEHAVVAVFGGEVSISRRPRR